MSSNDGEEALLVWVKSFPDLGVSEFRDLCAGIPLAKICEKIDSKHFSSQWVSRLTQTTPENVPLCQLNSNKVVEKVLEFYSLVLQRESNLRKVTDVLEY